MHYARSSLPNLSKKNTLQPTLLRGFLHLVTTEVSGCSRSETSTAHHAIRLLFIDRYMDWSLVRSLYMILQSKGLINKLYFNCMNSAVVLWIGKSFHRSTPSLECSTTAITAYDIIRGGTKLVDNPLRARTVLADLTSQQVCQSQLSKHP